MIEKAVEEGKLEKEKVKEFLEKVCIPSDDMELIKEGIEKKYWNGNRLLMAKDVIRKTPNRS